MAFVVVAGETSMKTIAAAVFLLIALFVLFVVLPIGQAFRYFEDEDR